MPGTVERIDGSILLAQEVVERADLSTQAKLLGVEMRPGVDLVIRLPQDDAPAARCQIGQCDFCNGTHVVIGQREELRSETMELRSMIGDAVIAPLAIYIRTGAQNDPETFLG